MEIKQLLGIIAIAITTFACTKDKGLYYAIRGNATNYGLEYDLDNYHLMILHDTLRLGNMKLLPISTTEAHILPFRTTVTKSTYNGYSYQVDARGTGVISVNGGNLSATFQKVAIDNSSSRNYSVTYFNGIPSALPLTRSDYTGKYAGFSTNAFGILRHAQHKYISILYTTFSVWLLRLP